MSRSATALLVIAGLYGAAGVATAAAAAHTSGDPRLAVVSQFLMIHAAALVGLVGAAGAYGLGRWLTVPGWGLAIGALLFCGDLLVRVAFGASPVPLAAPIGGVVLIAGWAALSAGAAIGGVRRRRP